MLIRLFLALALAFMAVSARGQLFSRSDELLQPDKAFRISAQALDERTVEVQFRIADGYYMYRDRFSFAMESGKPLADVQIPRGEPKEDEFFGRTETFRDLVRMQVPVSAEDAAKGSVNLKVTSQGCSDKGVCYTPLEQTVKVSLPAVAAARPSGKGPNSSAVPWILIAAGVAGAGALGSFCAAALVRRSRRSPPKTPRIR